VLDTSGTPTFCCADGGTGIGDTVTRAQSPALPRRSYTSWRDRFGAWVIDMTPIVACWAVWEALDIGSAVTDCVTYENGGVACTADRSPVSDIAFALMVLLAAAYLVWNFGYRQGSRGSSFGKSVMKFQVVDEKTWQPLGFATSMLRQAVHLLDAVVCFVGFLFPLWDTKRQTLTDKLMGTVCVRSAPKRF